MGKEDDAERDRFLALYGPLRRFARVVCPADVDPDDLVQEALARTLARTRLRDLDEPIAYLRMAVAHTAMNASRSRRRRLAREARARPQATTSEADYPSDLDDLCRLAPQARGVLFLTIVEGRSYAEAAEAVGCSEAAARQIASRSLRQLRAEISEELAAGGTP